MSKDLPSFAEIIEDAQKTPEQRSRLDVASPFGLPIPPDHRVVTNIEGKAHGVPEYDFKVEIHYFTLPGDKTEYEDTLNRVARGEAMVRFEKDSFNKEGDFITVVCLLVPTEPKKAKTARDRRLQEEEDDLIRRLD